MNIRTNSAAGQPAAFAMERTAGEKVVALAGNPNVGKSTVFNALTGMHQHTGNWPGKTVANAQGSYRYEGQEYILVDIPGTYSLMAHSAEEEAARDFICFGEPDAVAVVCDATCLERNMNLVLQTLEITKQVILCVNLMDEAKKKGIRIDLAKLEERLGIPVVGMSARSRKGLADLTGAIKKATASSGDATAYRPQYPKAVEEAVEPLIIPVQTAAERASCKLNPRWAALKLLCGDNALLEALVRYHGLDLISDGAVSEALKKARSLLKEKEIGEDKLRDMVAASLVLHAEEVCDGTIQFAKTGYDARDRRLDRIFIGRRTGIPIMLLLLAGIFWITIVGANVPSEILSGFFNRVEDWLRRLLGAINTPEWFISVLLDGVFRVLAWVVAVMLPPMAIFFPLFTLLEDAGYLPRVAFNLDRGFRKCNACGKQSLTTCMGFGCNAVGVTGCRIIDSPRERLIAILTNSFVPCNGRLPPPGRWKQSPVSGPIWSSLT